LLVVVCLPECLKRLPCTALLRLRLTGDVTLSQPALIAPADAALTHHGHPPLLLPTRFAPRRRHLHHASIGHEWLAGRPAACGWRINHRMVYKMHPALEK